MLRDDFMQRVISREKEPITPFLERTVDLYGQAGISTILVAGSSGAFFYIADKILQMDCYRPVDITEHVKNLCTEYPAPSTQAPGFAIPEFNRTLLPISQNKRRNDQRRGSRENTVNRHERMKIRTSGKDSFSLDKENVDLRYVEQLIDSEQTCALAYLLRYTLEQLMDGHRSVQQIVTYLSGLLDQKGWDAFSGSSYVPCGLARPRIQEIYACLNRFRN
jgi:predicted ABC-class ATPase